MWDRLEFLTQSTVFYLDARHVAAYCPVCRDGTLLVTFADINGMPAARYSSRANPNGCSAGCSSDLIVDVIA